MHSIVDTKERETLNKLFCSLSLSVMSLLLVTQTIVILLLRWKSLPYTSLYTWMEGHEYARNDT